MGVPLTPIVVKDVIDLPFLRGKRPALDGNGELYQFLALIRQRDGTPLHDETGRITSHLSGLFYRTTRLIADYGVGRPFRRPDARSCGVYRTVTTRGGAGTGSAAPVASATAINNVRVTRPAR